MNQLGFPLLTLITFLPLVGIPILLLLPRDREEASKWVAFGISVLTFIVSLRLLLNFAPGEAGPQLVDRAAWVPQWGINYFLGVDGISLWLVLLTTLLSPIAPLPLVGIPLVEGGARMLTVAGLLLMVCGVAWALVNINSLPMVVDMTSAVRIGTFTGLYYLFSTLAAIVGPNINGWAIQLTGNNYNLIMIIAPIFMLAALLMLIGVRRGEALAE